MSRRRRLSAGDTLRQAAFNSLPVTFPTQCAAEDRWLGFSFSTGSSSNARNNAW
jgi:hypothetical protein